MKTPYDFTKDILSNLDHVDINGGDTFPPYLIQKYISGVSPAYCNLINNILNNKLMYWKDPQEIYDFLKCILPKTKTPTFKYFKKNIDIKPEKKVDFQQLSEVLEISQKNLREMFEYFPELKKNLKEDDGKILKARK